MSDILELTDPIITSHPETRTICEILSSYDGPAFEKATTTYRKPSYQRSLQKSDDWCKDLIESALRGYSIGALIMSQWTKKFQLEDSEGFETFFNVEDGQTRLDALDRFVKGNFTTKYGGYEVPRVKAKFDNIKLPVIVQRKAKPRISDKVYHKQLLDNFSKLQEGTTLSNSDRYFVWVMDLPNGIEGSPLVNFTLKFTNTQFGAQFKEFMNLDKIDSRSGHKCRQNLADAVALVSACWRGPGYANNSYHKHLDILMEEWSEEDVERVTQFLKIIFATIKSNFLKYKKQKSEHIKKVFLGARTYLGAMISDLYDAPNQDRTNFINKWSTLISIHRHMKRRDGPDHANEWLHKTVYAGLSNDEITRVAAAEFRLKCAKVSEWWENHLLNATDYDYEDTDNASTVVSDDNSSLEEYDYSDEEDDE